MRKIILAERNGEPMHFAAIAKESLRRGYTGRATGSPDEIESRTVQSFWAALSRSDEMESIGKGLYKLGTETSEPTIGAGPPYTDSTAEGRVRVQSESWAGLAARIVLAKGPLTLRTIVNEIRATGKGETVRDLAATINSAMWRRYEDLFDKKGDLYHLKTKDIDFV